MQPRSIAGGGLLVAGLLGYVAAIYVSYPGRAFSLTAIMAGIALFALGGAPGESTIEEAS